MKKFLAILLAGIMILSLAACGQKETEFDAKQYVQDALDAKYHQEYKAYAEGIGVSEEEAKEQLVSEFNDSLKTQIEQAGLIASEEELEQYFQMEADARIKVQYEVKEAVKDEEENYTVEVVVTPFDAYALFHENLSANLQTAVNGGAAEEDYMGVFLDTLQHSIENAPTAEAASFTFHVTYEEKDGMKVYTIDADEVYEFDLVAMNQM